MRLTPNWNAEEDHNKARGTSLIGKVVYVHMQEPMKDPLYALSTAYIIGYSPEKNKDDAGYYTMVSLADGMTLHAASIEDLIRRLNDQPYVPMPSSALQAAMAAKIPLV